MSTFDLSFLQNYNQLSIPSKSYGLQAMQDEFYKNTNQYISRQQELPTSGSVSDLEETSPQGFNWEHAGQTAGTIGKLANIASQLLPTKSEYSGTYGSTTQALDNAYTQVENVVGSIPVYGQFAKGLMQANALVGKGINAIGGGTDGMTKLDSILGSSFFATTPFGMINGFGGKHSDSITKNDQAFEQVGASYTGSNNAVDDALKKSNKKYGLFSSGALNDANTELRQARLQQFDVANISDTASDRRAISNSMSAINDNRRRYHMQGGYNQRAISVGKQGGLLLKSRKTLQRIKAGSKVKTQTDPYQIYLESLPKNQRDDKDFRVKDYWEFNGKPKDFNEAVQKGMFIKLSDGWHAKSVATNPNTGEIEYMKSESHPTRYMESDWYEKGLIYNQDGSSIQLQPGTPEYKEWQDFTNDYDLIKESPYWKYVKKPPKLQTGGTLQEPSIVYEVYVEPLSEFKEGGKFNIIPDGALHARKHHMNVEGITKKGIPVVSESEGGEIEQQAEIEREELIIRLEITKKLEELLKEYNAKETTQKRKDELAVDAGKLLTQELIHNTKNNAK